MMQRLVLGSLSVLAIATPLALPTLALSHRGDRPSPNPATLNQIAATVERSGKFVTAEPSHPTQGTARIVKEGNKRYLEFDQQFRTVQGPDVKVVLHRANKVGIKLNAKDYITLAPLTRFQGAQRYEIPANIDLSQYGSVVVWCREFNVTFGYADL